MTTSIPVLSPIARRLEAIMFGQYEDQYRVFAQAVLVVAVGLSLAWGLAAFGLVPLSDGTTLMLATAASIAISAFVVVGLLQFLVMANVLERTNEDVATKAAELEQAAEQLEQTAEELETTAGSVEDAATTVDEAAEDVEQTADEVEQTATATGDEDAAEKATEAKDKTTEAKDKTSDAKETAESVTEEVEAAKETASDVEETAAEKRERLANADSEDDTE
ncbi:hypothetical protein NDI85_14875 [Halomicroarcula sp. S1AR25-4]|uniref:hypothetical protein n=1 Tax=Haloarcula sp. S1AR25-4 TaxID=2950538 RepID=UPI00287695AE|nr:hypothetical protein [Halomicroarcula sp. S1AR25-4]MDS0279082.1 hypothetical protein [Halomicroarcula sp. S1AR25-4]